MQLHIDFLRTIDNMAVGHDVSIDIINPRRSCTDLAATCAPFLRTRCTQRKNRRFNNLCNIARCLIDFFQRIAASQPRPCGNDFCIHFRLAESANRLRSCDQHHNRCDCHDCRGQQRLDFHCLGSTRGIAVLRCFSVSPNDARCASFITYGCSPSWPDFTRSIQIFAAAIICPPS